MITQHSQLPDIDMRASFAIVASNWLLFQSPVWSSPLVKWKRPCSKVLKWWTDSSGMLGCLERPCFAVFAIDFFFKFPLLYSGQHSPSCVRRPQAVGDEWHRKPGSRFHGYGGGVKSRVATPCQRLWNVSGRCERIGGNVRTRGKMEKRGAASLPPRLPV